MKKSTLAHSGSTVGLLFVALYLVCLAWQYFLTEPTLITLHQQLFALTFPGFTWLTVGSFFWGALLSFVYGWIGVAIFRLTCTLSCGGTMSGSCCQK